MRRVNRASEILLPSLRQYRHNDTDGFVMAYEKDGAERTVSAMQVELERLRAAHSFPHVSRFGKHLTLVFEADELSNDEKRSLFERARAMSWSHAIDDRKAAEKERDQLKERLAVNQRMLASGILYTYDELLRHDAEVIERAVKETQGVETRPWLCRKQALLDYANQLRQQAKEVQT